jgi:hypothetical protein
MSGIEEYPNKDYSKSGGIAFSRIIDANFITSPRNNYDK